MTESFGFLPNSWSDTERSLYENAFELTPDAVNDGTLQALYDNAYFNMDANSDHISAIREALSDYLMREYDVDFDAVFDWDVWRESYEGDG